MIHPRLAGRSFGNGDNSEPGGYWCEVQIKILSTSSSETWSLRRSVRPVVWALRSRVVVKLVLRGIHANNAAKSGAEMMRVFW